MVDTAVVREQLDAAHGALKAAMNIIETLYGALEVAEQQRTPEPPSEIEGSPTLDLACGHRSFLPAAVMGRPNRKVCTECGDSFDD